MISPGAKSNVTCIYVAHVFVVAALLTAGFMLTTAAELGPMGPLVIAEALYMAAFAFIVELGLAARAGLAAILRAIERRRASTFAQGDATMSHHDTGVARPQRLNACPGPTTSQPRQSLEPAGQESLK